MPPGTPSNRPDDGLTEKLVTSLYLATSVERHAYCMSIMTGESIYE